MKSPEADVVATIKWNLVRNLRLPNDGRRVLVASGEVIKIGQFGKDGEEDVFVADDGFLVPLVHAWAELPEAPPRHHGALGSSDVSGISDSVSR
jgi:hypothetical protein